MIAEHIRPHHGLCTLFFEGKGYSKAFTDRMWKIIYEAEQGSELRLVCRADGICEVCPNRRGVRCAGGNALVYDEKVLSLTGLREGMTVTLGQLQQAVQEKILQPGKWEEVCGDCQWAEICRRKAAENIQSL